MQTPPLGTRVMIRHRLPVGSVPPLTDVIGHLVATAPTLQVRTKRGHVVAVAVENVVVIKALAAAPVRTADIRNLEHAAALAWPGVEQQWVDGWLCRFGHGSTRRANSAVPLDFSVTTDMRAVADWYAARSVPPLVSAPDRLFRIPAYAPTEAENSVMACDIEQSHPQHEVTLAARPDDEWLRIYDRDVPIEVLSAIVDGEVDFRDSRGSGGGTGGRHRCTRRDPLVGLVRAEGHQGPAPPRSRTVTVHRIAQLGRSPRRTPRVYTGT